MLAITVKGIPAGMKDSIRLEQLRKHILAVVMTMDLVRVRNEGDVACHFDTDLQSHVLKPIIVEIIGFEGSKERTADNKLCTQLKAIFPKYLDIDAPQFAFFIIKGEEVKI